MFSINSSTGELKINGTLDYESVSTYNLVLRVTDGFLADEAAVVVYVSDVNEVPVAKDGQVQLPENTSSGGSVTTVIATDLDAGSVLQFSIEAGNTGSTFHIDASTGELKVNNAQFLNFETTPSYTLTVRVTDGVLSDDATITIQILDVNEPPSIEDGIVYVDENSPKDIVLFTVQASDPDAASKLVFTITSGNEGDIFLINTNAELILAKQELDFELKNSFNLSIQVTDGVYTDHATLSIHINDVNEKPSVQSASAQVAETVSEGSIIHSVIADDPDTGAVLQYAIVEGNYDEAFVINEMTGSIAVNHALDFEAVPMFHLIIRASDGALFSDAAVIVYVADVNEAPSVEAATVNVQQPVDPEEVLYIVGASDPDADDVLTFSIQNTDAEPMFLIDPATGEIRLADVHPSISKAITSDLLVKVTDSEGLSGSAIIRIHLLPIRELSHVRPWKGFSPNGDGQNDFWLIEGIEAFPDNVIRIYNRWGIKVYEVRGYDNAQRTWAGETSGTLLNSENTYFYIIEVPEFEPITGYVISKP
jgi:gliding motility-associated-like protein